MLYQRYFLRMNQSNTTHILSLLLALVLTLVAVHIFFIPIEGGIKMTSSTSLANATAAAAGGATATANSAVDQNRSSIIFENNTFNMAAARKEWKNQKLQNADETETANGNSNIEIYNRTEEMVNHSYYGIENSNNNPNSLLSNLHLKYQGAGGMKRMKRYWANESSARDDIAAMAAVATAAADTPGNRHDWSARKQFKTYVRRK